MRQYHTHAHALLQLIVRSCTAGLKRQTRLDILLSIRSGGRSAQAEDCRQCLEHGLDEFHIVRTYTRMWWLCACAHSTGPIHAWPARLRMHACMLKTSRCAGPELLGRIPGTHILEDRKHSCISIGVVLSVRMFKDGVLLTKAPKIIVHWIIKLSSNETSVRDVMAEKFPGQREHAYNIIYEFV